MTDCVLTSWLPPFLFDTRRVEKSVNLQQHLGWRLVSEERGRAWGQPVRAGLEDHDEIADIAVGNRPRGDNPWLVASCCHVAVIASRH